MIPAVAYVRMSTDLQKYSTENQLAAIQLYAEQRGCKIIKVYEDSGRSGLNIKGRDAFRELIDDVESKKANFKLIIVYDVSRWGRFQNADESAHYEFLCSRAGIAVHYCAEQFENDGSLGSHLLKSVRSVMVGEYSRELSVKVFAGQCRLIEMGYRQGGMAGFGLRRMLVDEHGNTKGELKFGERKSLQTDRVVLISGPDFEVKIVRRIFHLFVEERRTEKEIASILNSEGVVSDLGRNWTSGTIRQLLTNEKYIGNNVYNKRSFKLKKQRVRNNPEIWVRRNDVFPAIISQSFFEAARRIFEARHQRLSNDELLTLLKSAIDTKGVISGIIIDEMEDMPPSSIFRRRFGSLLRAYKLVGYDPRRDYEYIEINKKLRREFEGQIYRLINDLHLVGASVERDPDTDVLLINSEFRTSVIIARCKMTGAGSLRWKVRLDTGLLPDITIIVRMDERNIEPLDYYVLPSIDIMQPRLRILERNPFGLEAYRFPSLEFFLELTQRVKLEEVA